MNAQQREMDTVSDTKHRCQPAALRTGLTALLVCASAVVQGHPPDVAKTHVDAAGEALIHTPPGFASEGKPVTYAGQHPAQLQVAIVDRATGQPTFCRVNVVGSDGNFYEPRENILAPWSLRRMGNRLGKGPFRYYGWFFFTAGKFEVEVPPGPTRLEVWKGFEYRPQTCIVAAAADAVSQVKLQLQRTASMAAQGYYSGDTHIHLPRRDAAGEARALDLLAAEDIQYGSLLAWNRGPTYTASMDHLDMPQRRGFGPTSVLERGPYAIASGQEYIDGYNHLCLLLHSRLVQEGRSFGRDGRPLPGLIGREARELGGYSIHAHGGYGCPTEIYIDAALRVTDGVELMQFADYRGISLEGWYRMLNVGYRLPAVGACDYPYCRALGDSRTYVYSPNRPAFTDWVRRATQGRSFFTTGPLLLLELDGHRPGDLICRRGGDAQMLAKVRVRSEVAPVTYVELILNGRSFARRGVPAGHSQEWFQIEVPLMGREPTWVAAKAGSTSPPGRPDAEAHTNPIYVAIDGKLPYDDTDLDWLVERVDDVTRELNRRPPSAEKSAALVFYAKSRQMLIDVRNAHGQRLSDRERSSR